MDSGVLQQSVGRGCFCRINGSPLTTTVEFLLAPVLLQFVLPSLTKADGNFTEVHSEYLYFSNEVTEMMV